MRTALLLTASMALFASRPLQVDDLFKVKKVADPQLSVAGALAYQVGTVDFAANKTVTRIWFKAAGAEAKELDLGTGSHSRPRFSPDGKKLAYQSGGQVWIVDLGTKQKHQLTKLSGGAGGQTWSPDGKWIAFLSTTVPSGIEAENAAYLKAKGGLQGLGPPLHHAHLPPLERVEGCQAGEPPLRGARRWQRRTAGPHGGLHHGRAQLRRGIGR
ncbi:MAG: PD40 domain-containing protein [Holophagaceae bacterium]|nr:PD40 domain-containing protein [Holophagaceae bacterium]